MILLHGDFCIPSNSHQTTINIHNKGISSKYRMIIKHLRSLQNGSERYNSKYYDSRYYQGKLIVTFNAIVSDYMLNDTYLPAFEISIKNGGAKCVVCLIKDVMRGLTAYDGYVTSDSGAIMYVYENHHTTSLPLTVAVATNATCDVDSYLGVAFAMNSDCATDSPYQEYMAGLNIFAAKQIIIFLKNGDDASDTSDNAWDINDVKSKIAAIRPHYNAQQYLLYSGYTAPVCMDRTFDCVACITQELETHVGEANYYSAKDVMLNVQQKRVLIMQLKL